VNEDRARRPRTCVRHADAQGKRTPFRNRGIVLALLLTLACSRATEVLDDSRRGQLSFDIYPNPIIARRVEGNVYEFPFEVSVREVGGVDVEIVGLQVDVFFLSGVRIFSQPYGPEELSRRQLPTRIPAGSNIQYSFSPRREVPSETLIRGVSAEIILEGIDAQGRSTEARTRVTVRGN